MRTSEILRIQIDSDFKELLDEIDSGLYNGNWEEEEKAWKSLSDKIIKYRKLRRKEKKVEE